jgi:hypothetical protein
MPASLRDIVILISLAAMVVVGWYYGYRFLKLKNDILGVEWMIIGFSATCFFVNRLGLSESSVEITWFLDLFSRLIGIPILGTIGVMKVTHGRDFTRRQEIWMFAIGLLVSAAFKVSSALQAMLPVLYLVLGVAFLALVAYMAYQAFKRGLRMHGWLMVVAVLLNLGVALLQDFAKLPDENTAIFFNQLVIEGFVWAFGLAAMFYTYEAMQNTPMPKPVQHRMQRA